MLQGGDRVGVIRSWLGGGGRNSRTGFPLVREDLELPLQLQRRRPCCPSEDAQQLRQVFVNPPHTHTHLHTPTFPPLFRICTPPYPRSLLPLIWQTCLLFIHLSLTSAPHLSCFLTSFSLFLPPSLTPFRRSQASHAESSGGSTGICSLLPERGTLWVMPTLSFCMKMNISWRGVRTRGSPTSEPQTAGLQR